MHRLSKPHLAASGSCASKWMFERMFVYVRVCMHAFVCVSVRSWGGGGGGVAIICIVIIIPGKSTDKRREGKQNLNNRCCAVLFWSVLWLLTPLWLYDRLLHVGSQARVIYSAVCHFCARFGF